jgi:D-arabinose 1-dehydrogenase-like Zn-dependent alcohol dehydrogenase
MRAIVLHTPGPADHLVLEELAAPELLSGHVLVRVRASGVCYRDLIDRQGGFPMMKLPVVPGHELAGEVVEVGDGVTGLAVGDRVVNLHRPPCGECRYCRAGHEPRCVRALFSYGMTADGTYAELCLAPEASLVKLPAGIPFEEACFLHCTAGVALRALRTRAALVEGETVLVTGASGGVGIHALQVAKALGAGRVVAVTSSPAKVEPLRAHGADDVVVSGDLAFHRDVKRRTDGGADVALDCVGEPTLNASFRSLAPLGRAVILGNVTMGRYELNPGYAILNEVSIAGSAGCTREDLALVLRWVEEGTLRPVVADVLDLAAAADAHRRLEARGVTGRLVLRP